MADDKEKNALGDRQAAYAGTNTNRYDAPKPADEQDNPIRDEEAQNVTDGTRPLSGEEAEHERNKANTNRTGSSE